MLLRSLTIKNYRSLEDVTLDGLGRFGVLIGRNSAGKSSVFNVLALLAQAVGGQGYLPQWDRDLTDHDGDRSLEVRLVFDPQPEERRDFIGLLYPHGEPAWGSGQRQRERLLDSPFFRRVEFSFQSFRISAEGPHHVLHLRQTRLQAEDGDWATVQQLQPEVLLANPLHHFSRLSELVGEDPSVRRLLDDAPPLRFTAARIDISGSAPSSARLQTSELGRPLPDPVVTWPQRRLVDYLTRAFFLSPFRHSVSSVLVRPTPQLAQDGANLAQVLSTLRNGGKQRRTQFEKIEAFVQNAIPGIGLLDTPLVGTEAALTEVSFSATHGSYDVRLHDMGGGVEQLLMVAVVLLTTGDDSPLFLEEPESHLHAGAQRFLIERLYEGGRQVFVTTHSPTFINLSRPRTLYQIAYAGGRSTITRVRDAEGLDAVLEDIGARNSDVFLSDAVLFVEGKGDKGAFEGWGETLRDALGATLAERNVVLLPMGGGEAARGAPIRSDVLEGISDRAPVPHLFVLDRDERRQADVDRLRRRFGDTIHFLGRRELENYLLVPRALLAALRDKQRDDPAALERIGALSEGDVRALIEREADRLRDTVLIKRIRAELGGLVGGWLSDEVAQELVSQVHDADFPGVLRAAVEARLGACLADLDIPDIVAREREAVAAAWVDGEERLRLAPGEELVQAVFGSVGATYAKPKDTERIARELRTDEIPDEIKRVIERAISLPTR